MHQPMSGPSKCSASHIMRSILQAVKLHFEASLLACAVNARSRVGFELRNWKKGRKYVIPTKSIRLICNIKKLQQLWKWLTRYKQIVDKYVSNSIHSWTDNCHIHSSAICWTFLEWYKNYTKNEKRNIKACQSHVSKSHQSRFPISRLI